MDNSNGNRLPTPLSVQPRDDAQLVIALEAQRRAAEPAPEAPQLTPA